MPSEAKITVRLIEKNLSPVAQKLDLMVKNIATLSKTFSGGPLDRSLKSLSQNINKVTEDTKRATDALSKMKSLSFSGMPPMGGQGNGVKNYTRASNTGSRAGGGYMGAFGAGVGIYGTLNILRSAAEAEKGKIEIDKVVKETEKGLRPEFYKLAEKMSMQYGISLVEAQKTVGRTFKFADFSLDQFGGNKIKATEELSKLTMVATQAWDMDPIAATGVLASVQSKYNLDMQQLQAFMLTLNDVANAFGAVRESDIARALKRLPASEGLELQDAVYLLGQIKQVSGMEASGVSSGMLKSLLKIEGKYASLEDYDNKQLSSAMQEMKGGIDFSRIIAKTGTDDIVGFVKELGKQLEGMSNLQKSDFLKSEFGISEVRSRLAFLGMIDTYKEDAQSLKAFEASNKYIISREKATKKLKDSGMSDDQVYEELIKNQEMTAEAMNEFVEEILQRNKTYFQYAESLKRLKEDIGSAFIDTTMRENQETFNEYIAYTRDFVENNKSFVGAVFTIVGALAGVSAAVWTARLAILPAVGLMKLVAVKFTALAGFILKGLAVFAIANPIVASIIAAVTAVGVLIYRYWDQISSFFKSTSEVVSDTLSKHIDTNKSLNEKIKNSKSRDSEFDIISEEERSKNVSEILKSRLKMDKEMMYYRPQNSKIETKQDIDIKVSTEGNVNVDNVEVRNKVNGIGGTDAASSNFKTNLQTVPLI